jgi:putative ABC transport system substrate-binding protein
VKLGKQLELIAEFIPGISTVGMLYAAGSDTSMLALQPTEDAAIALRLKLLTRELRAASEIEPALQMLVHNVEAVIMPADVMFLVEARRFVPWLAAARLPAIHSYREHVQAGGLMSYAVNLPESFRRAAHYADKILKGAKPGDLLWSFRPSWSW